MKCKLSVQLVCLTVLIACQASAQEDINSQQNIPALLLLESVTDLLSTPAIEDKCLSVHPQGDFHIELRQQLHPGDPLTRKFYEGILDSTQRNSLKVLLEHTRIKGRPDSILPSVPATSSTIKAAKARIKYEKNSQNIGYVHWFRPSRADEDKATVISHEGATADEIEQQNRVEQDLQPLLTWFGSLLQTKLTESKATSSICAQISE